MAKNKVCEMLPVTVEWSDDEIDVIFDVAREQHLFPDELIRRLTARYVRKELARKSH